MNIHQRFKLIRKELKMTQTELGKKIGKKLRTIQDYEYEKATITDGVLLTLQEKFNVNIDWLRTGEGEMFLKKEENKRYDFLLKMLDDFSDEELAEIIKTTQAMANKKNNRIENVG